MLKKYSGDSARGRNFLKERVIRGRFFSFSLHTGFWLLSNEVCSNYISPVRLFMRFFAWPIFCLTSFDFLSSKTGLIAQAPFNSLGAFQLTSLQVDPPHTPPPTHTQQTPPPPHISPSLRPLPLHIIQTVRAPCSQRPPSCQLRSLTPLQLS